MHLTAAIPLFAIRTRSIRRWPRDFDKNSAIDENSTATRGLSFFSRRENILHSGKIRNKKKEQNCSYNRTNIETKCFGDLVFYVSQIVLVLTIEFEQIFQNESIYWNGFSVGNTDRFSSLEFTQTKLHL